MRRVSILWMVFAAAAVAALASAQPIEPSLYGDLRWRLVGPFRGGWATVAEGVPDEPATYYFGAAAGGVWKTENAGRTWSPIFDQAGAASVGALALAPSNPKVIYVGTGQIQARYDIASGDGVYRSDDAGASWRKIGLADSRAIGRILVDPKNPDVALVAALGHIFGANRERGVYRTEDGGRSWSQVLFVDEATGAADLAADPENPSIVYASMWQARNYPWLSYFKPMIGPGSGLFKSVDAGKTWKRVAGGGFPAGPLGRIGLGAGLGGRVFALVDAPAEPGKPGNGGLWRSDDSGGTWTRVNATPGLASSYINRVTADPKRRDLVYVMGQSIRRSSDGGTSFEFFRGAPGGDDFHFLWVNPKHPELMVAAADQGTIVTVDGGKSWSDWYNQPTGQFYHVEADDRFPYWIYSGQQDSGTAGTATRSDFGQITFRDWHPVGGEERGWDVPDPRDPQIVYGSGLGGTITRFDGRTGQVRNVSPAAESTYGRRPVPGVYRWAWVFPIAMAKTPPHALYAGSQYLLRSLDEGQTWEKASPDLSGAAASAPKGCEGEVTLSNAGPCGFGVIFTIEISPRDASEIWIGTDDGLIQRTKDGGKTWKNVTPAGLPAWSKISTLDVSALEPDVVYAAVDAHRRDDFMPHVYRTHDGGQSWQEISAGLPPGGFAMVVRADTVRKGLLYAGTDTGAFVSFDDGGSWQPLRLNLPTCWIGDLQVHGTDLVVATQGRGLWVLDDVTPLRQLSAAAGTAPATLFAPAEAIRARNNENRDTPLPPEVPFAHNPPPGAVIDYVLGQPASSPVKLEILDARGETVRAWASDDPPANTGARVYFTDLYLHPPAPPAATAGHHRFVWDLRYPRPKSDRYEYMISAVAGENTPIDPRGPLAPPGNYTVRLTAGGSRSEKPLVLKPDPRTSASPEVYAQRLAYERQVAAAMNESYETLVRVRSIHRELAARNERLGGKPAPHALSGALAESDRVEKAAAAANALLGSLLQASDGADAVPTSIQTGALSKTRTELERLVSDAKSVEAQARSLGVTASEIERDEEDPIDRAGTEIE